MNHPLPASCLNLTIYNRLRNLILLSLFVALGNIGILSAQNVCPDDWELIPTAPGVTETGQYLLTLYFNNNNDCSMFETPTSFTINGADSYVVNDKFVECGANNVNGSIYFNQYHADPIQGPIANQNGTPGSIAFNFTSSEPLFCNGESACPPQINVYSDGSSIKIPTPMCGAFEEGDEITVIPLCLSGLNGDGPGSVFEFKNCIPVDDLVVEGYYFEFETMDPLPGCPGYEVHFPDGTIGIYNFNGATGANGYQYYYLEECIEPCVGLSILDVWGGLVGVTDPCNEIARVDMGCVSIGQMATRDFYALNCVNDRLLDGPPVPVVPCPFDVEIIPLDLNSTSNLTDNASGIRLLFPNGEDCANFPIVLSVRFNDDQTEYQVSLQQSKSCNISVLEEANAVGNYVELLFLNGQTSNDELKVPTNITSIFFDFVSAPGTTCFFGAIAEEEQNRQRNGFNNLLTGNIECREFGSVPCCAPGNGFFLASSCEECEIMFNGNCYTDPNFCPTVAADEATDDISQQIIRAITSNADTGCIITITDIHIDGHSMGSLTADMEEDDKGGNRNRSAFDIVFPGNSTLPVDIKVGENLPFSIKFTPQRYGPHRALVSVCYENTCPCEEMNDKPCGPLPLPCKMICGDLGKCPLGWACIEGCCVLDAKGPGNDNENGDTNGEVSCPYWYTFEVTGYGSFCQDTQPGGACDNCPTNVGTPRDEFFENNDINVKRGYCYESMMDFFGNNPMPGPGRRYVLISDSTNGNSLLTQSNGGWTPIADVDYPFVYKDFSSGSFFIVSDESSPKTSIDMVMKQADCGAFPPGSNFKILQYKNNKSLEDEYWIGTYKMIGCQDNILMATHVSGNENFDCQSPIEVAWPEIKSYGFYTKKNRRCNDVWQLEYCEKPEFELSAYDNWGRYIPNDAVCCDYSDSQDNVSNQFDYVSYNDCVAWSGIPTSDMNCRRLGNSFGCVETGMMKTREFSLLNCTYPLRKRRRSSDELFPFNGTSSGGRLLTDMLMCRPQLDSEELEFLECIIGDDGCDIVIHDIFIRNNRRAAELESEELTEEELGPGGRRNSSFELLDEFSLPMTLAQGQELNFDVKFSPRKDRRYFSEIVICYDNPCGCTDPFRPSDLEDSEAIEEELGGGSRRGNCRSSSFVYTIPISGNGEYCGRKGCEEECFDSASQGRKPFKPVVDENNSPINFGGLVVDEFADKPASGDYMGQSCLVTGGQFTGFVFRWIGSAWTTIPRNRYPLFYHADAGPGEVPLYIVKSPGIAPIEIAMKLNNYDRFNCSNYPPWTEVIIHHFNPITEANAGEQKEVGEAVGTGVFEVAACNRESLFLIQKSGDPIPPQAGELLIEVSSTQNFAYYYHDGFGYWEQDSPCFPIQTDLFIVDEENLPICNTGFIPFPPPTDDWPGDGALANADEDRFPFRCSFEPILFGCTEPGVPVSKDLTMLNCFVPDFGPFANGEEEEAGSNRETKEFEINCDNLFFPGNITTTKNGIGGFNSLIGSDCVIDITDIVIIENTFCFNPLLTDLGPDISFEINGTDSDFTITNPTTYPTNLTKGQTLNLGIEFNPDNLGTQCATVVVCYENSCMGCDNFIRDPEIEEELRGDGRRFPCNGSKIFTFNIAGCAAEFATTDFIAPEFTDPCGCEDELNLFDLDDGSIEFFHDVLTVKSAPGETWFLDSLSTGSPPLYDINGDTLMGYPVMMQPGPADSLYVLDVWHRPDEAVIVNFINNVSPPATLKDQAVDVCADICNTTIPTLGEWGLIMLSLIMLIFGTVAIRQPKLAILKINEGSRPLKL